MVLGKVLYEPGNELGSEGMLSFLYADGENLSARSGDSLCSRVRKAPFGPATLVDAEIRVDYSNIMHASQDSSMAVVATAPLTRDEAWIKAAPGSLLVFGQGDLLHTFDPPPGYEKGSSVAPAWEPAWRTRPVVCRPSADGRTGAGLLDRQRAIRGRCELHTPPGVRVVPAGELERWTRTRRLPNPPRPRSLSTTTTGCGTRAAAPARRRW